MPLITELPDCELSSRPSSTSSTNSATVANARRQSQHSTFARSVLMNTISTAADGATTLSDPRSEPSSSQVHPPQRPSNHTANGPTSRPPANNELKPTTLHGHPVQNIAKDGVGAALTDTPNPTAPSSPRIPPLRNNSGSSTPRIRPTTLDIPGLTRSKVSPDGRIAQRDVGSKLVIIMVGLPARGKSYITKKVARYLNWLQHDTQIFNVGERRRIAVGGRVQGRTSALSASGSKGSGPISNPKTLDAHQVAAQILINGKSTDNNMAPLSLPSPLRQPPEEPPDAFQNEVMDQSAAFFDPRNKKAAQIREQAAMDTLDDLLDYVLNHGGAVGIFDATNSTLARRKTVMQRIRDRAGPELNVLFIESVCMDETLLEANMRLKLSGPDYKDKDPIAALDDFKKRVAIYERNYVPIGEYEEKNNMPYVQMIDVGRKVISHQIKGFLSAQAVYYLLNFNLAPRMIWITRHGESWDNVAGKIGGDANLSPNGQRYAQAMAKFIEYERKGWEIRQQDRAANTHFPPHPGDHTPPNPHYNADELEEHKNFCVWTSMLKRSVQCAEFFAEEIYEVKQMRMLDELYAGLMEGMTYLDIQKQYPEEYARRKRDKLSYRYPGPGGEGYLDVINRLRPVIVELERMTDHALLITHRSVARVLLAYFLGLRRDEVADLDCPLGMLYMLEPKPYGVEFKAYCYNAETDWFDFLPEFKLHRGPSH